MKEEIKEDINAEAFAFALNDLMANAAIHLPNEIHHSTDYSFIHHADAGAF